MKTAALTGVLIVLTLSSPSAVSAMGKRDAPPSSQPEGAEAPSDTRIIRGRVRVYGSEPHTYAGIETDDGKRYAVFPAEKEREILDLQGRLVEFTVVFSEEPQGYGSLFLRDGSVTPLSWRILP
jgi:hypothetical protein